MLGETHSAILDGMVQDLGAVDDKYYMDLEAFYSDDQEALQQLKQFYLPYCILLQEHMKERRHKRARGGRQGNIARAKYNWLDDNIK